MYQTHVSDKLIRGDEAVEEVVYDIFIMVNGDRLIVLLEWHVWISNV